MVKGQNNNAVAIKMVDNPPDLQAVISNEIIIISTKNEHLSQFSFQYLSALSRCLNIVYTVDIFKMQVQKVQIALDGWLLILWLHSDDFVLQKRQSKHKSFRFLLCYKIIKMSAI